MTYTGGPLSRGYRRLRRGRRARQVEGAHAPRHLHQEERLRQGKRKLQFGGLLTKISSAWVIPLICGTKMTNVSASFMRQNSKMSRRSPIYQQIYLTKYLLRSVLPFPTRTLSLLRPL